MMRCRSIPVLVLWCAAGLLGACGPAPRDLDELAVVDSAYVDPATRLPYSGPVFRAFADDPDRIQIEATLHDGAFSGDLTVFHRTGRVRYQGEMADGTQCGGWIQNDAAQAPEDPYQAIKEELESIVVYPACPEGPPLP